MFIHIRLYFSLRSEACGKGLRSLGLQQRENIIIYADTRADWLMAAIGCFKVNKISKFTNCLYE